MNPKPKKHLNATKLVGYPNERFLKRIYLAAALFSVVLVVSVVMLRTAFPKWTLLPKIILLTVMILDELSKL